MTKGQKESKAMKKILISLMAIKFESVFKDKYDKQKTSHRLRKTISSECDMQRVVSRNCISNFYKSTRERQIAQQKNEEAI